MKKQSNTKSISKRISEVRTNGVSTTKETTEERTGQRVLTSNGWEDVK